jgi:hypothetical protein
VPDRARRAGPTAATPAREPAAGRRQVVSTPPSTGSSTPVT